MVYSAPFLPELSMRPTDLAMLDLGIMPIHFQFTLWGTKKNVQYTPRTDEYTLAFQFRPVNQLEVGK
jgi:peptide/nickel transport system substrate-binding protein